MLSISRKRIPPAHATWGPPIEASPREDRAPPFGDPKQVGVESRMRGDVLVRFGEDSSTLILLVGGKVSPSILNMLFQEHYDLRLKWFLMKYLLVLLLLLY
jgi:hypothetical protein